MHRANHVRPILHKIGEVAQKHGCAVVIIMHLSNTNQSNPIYKGLGTIDIAGAARSILGIGINPKNEDENVMARLKAI